MQTPMNDVVLSNRRSALFARMGALPASGLDMVESALARAEAAIPAVPGTQRTVHGATVVDRPDALPAGTVPIPTGGAVIFEPPADKPAELAKVGGESR